MYNINIIIKESVYNGSVFLALEVKCFTHQDLMKWLVDETYSEKTLIAYKALCVGIDPNNQYMDDDIHFIIKQKNYVGIALFYGLKVYDLPYKRNDNNSSTLNNCDPIINFVCDEIITLNSSSEMRQLFNLVTKGTGMVPYVQSNLLSCFLARNFNHVPNLTENDYNVDLVNSDWTNKFRYNKDLAKLVINRNLLLNKIAPNYYKNVAYSFYYKVASKLYKEKLLNIEKNDLVGFNTLFPGIIDVKILCYNDIGYKLSLLNNETAGYLLGFPIQTIIPNEKQIKETINKLMEVGKEKYCEHIKTYVNKLFVQELPFSNDEPIKYANTTDVMLEDINNYVPFDIVSYQIGTHIYRFTRAEFSKLIESKKNPWTNDWFPQSILTELINRQTCANKLELPQARPLTEMLELLETNKLYSKIEENNENNENLDNDANSDVEMRTLSEFGLLMNYMLSGVNI